MNDFEEDVPPNDLQGNDLQSPGSGEVAPTIQTGKSLGLDDMRHNLAQKLLYGLLFLATLVIVAAIFVPVERLDSLREIATLIFAPLVTLAGTSFAWFYASRKNDRR